jgi:hypothetical protein
VIALAATALSLAACGGATKPTAAAATTHPAPSMAAPTTPAAAPSTSAGPTLNARGNIVKTLGQEGGWGVVNGQPAVTFVVDAITPNQPCDNPYAGKPVNGHFLGVHMRMATAPGFDPNQGSFGMSTYFWKFIGSNGVTNTSLTSPGSYSCLKDAENFPTAQLGPGQSYEGTIVLDLPETNGALIFAPGGVSNASGWEWDF